MTTASQTRQEALMTFLTANAGRTLTLDEISEGTGIPRSGVSYQCSVARAAGRPLVNPLPGIWGIPAEAAPPALQATTAAPPAPDEADGDEADDDEADDDEADDDEAEVNGEAFRAGLGTLLGHAMRNYTAALGLRQVTMMLVGKDKAGNMIVVNAEQQAFRLVEL